MPWRLSRGCTVGKPSKRIARFDAIRIALTSKPYLAANPPRTRRTSSTIESLATNYSPMSSSGGQMTGQSNPCSRQTRASARAFAAFAICAQFQVTRKSIPCTAAIAMCAASALRGIFPEARMRVANSVTSGVISSSGRPLSAFNRSRATPGSPALTSSVTSWERKAERHASGFPHHSLVTC
jgi:hypothetical protein